MTLMKKTALTTCFYLALLTGMIMVSGLGRAADEQVAGDQGVIPVEINKGKMIKLGQSASAIIIADPIIADIQVVSPKLLFVRGKKVGETSIYAVDSKDNTIFTAVVEVTHNLSKLEQTVKSVSPDSDIGFRTVDGGLVMEGYAPSAAESESIGNVASTFIGAGEKMVNMVKTSGSDQVTLQVKIVEMAHSDLKTLNLNLQEAFGAGNFSMQVLQGANIGFDSAGLVNRGTSTNTAILGQWQNDGTTLRSMVDVLETQGLVSVLAEPTLTTTSGKAASFLAGGEFPIAVNGGDNSISISYRPFGVSLNFTPVVMSKDRISITVAPEVSTIDFSNTVSSGSGISNPVILTRKASTTLEMGSGQTFALAGLLKNDLSNGIKKFPGLGDVPVLGALFRSQQFQNNQTELVILVTPYIVRPVAEKTMQTPLDGYKAPTDLQRLLLGNLYQQEPMTDEAPLSPPPAPPEPVLLPQSMLEPEQSVPLVMSEPASPPAPNPTPDAPESAQPAPSPQPQPGNLPMLHGAGGFMLDESPQPMISSELQP